MWCTQPKVQHRSVKYTFELYISQYRTIQLQREFGGICGEMHHMPDSYSNTTRCKSAEVSSIWTSHSDITFFQLSPKLSFFWRYEATLSVISDVFQTSLKHEQHFEQKTRFNKASVQMQRIWHKPYFIERKIVQRGYFYKVSVKKSNWS